MDEIKKNTLEEPMASYGKSFRMEELSFESVPNLIESLRSQGCISHDELVERVNKYI